MAWKALIAMTVAFNGTMAAQPRPIVAELYTSQGCSSCPPADRLLTELAQTRPDVLPLAFHVTYWDGLGWRDPYSLPAATARQQAHARQTGADSIYTPELVVEGGAGVVGSDRTVVAERLREAAAGLVTAAGLRLSRQGDQLAVEVGPGTGAARVLLVGYDHAHRTAIGRGENGGRTLLESNIVRSFQKLADWTGAALSLHAPAPPGETFAVLLEAPDGRVVGAARLSDPSS